jgi:hypothetical protein
MGSSRFVGIKVSLRRMRASSARLTPHGLPRGPEQMSLRLMSLVSYRHYGFSLYRWTAEWCRTTVDQVPRTRHFDTVCAVFRCATTSLRIPEDVRHSYAQWQLVLELNRTNVQLFHFRVEGWAFHSQSFGCTRCATYHSVCLFQSLKDELALDLLGHLARR